MTDSPGQRICNHDKRIHIRPVVLCTKRIPTTTCGKLITTVRCFACGKKWAETEADGRAALGEGG